MKVPILWLKDFVNIEINTSKLAQELTMAGFEVTSIEDSGKEKIFDIEVTPNRPDCLSIFGVAKEVAAITDKNLKYPDYVVDILTQRLEKSNKIEIEIEDFKDCNRYTARVLTGVEVKSSKTWIKKRIELVGLKPVNNIVDITNYCLFEWGQPLHAFDYDKIEGKKIIVRRAKRGERIVTIDGRERELNSEILVIADSKKPIAIAGILGGKDTEVTSRTKSILIESAHFAPILIRKASKILGIITESSYRFERSVNIEQIAKTSNIAVNIIIKMLQGVDIQWSKLIDVAKIRYPEREVSLRVSRLNQIMDTAIQEGDVKRILKRLNFGTVKNYKDKLIVEIPLSRQDIKREIDLIEEIARIYRYQNIKSKPAFYIRPNLEIQQIHQKQRKFEENIRISLFQTGLNETLTYSLIKSKDLKRLRLGQKNIIQIKNPLSENFHILRPTLITGILDTIIKNIRVGLDEVEIFELSKVYLLRNDKTAKEVKRLAIGICGTELCHWEDSYRMLDFFYLKGIIEKIFRDLRIYNYEFVRKQIDLFSLSTSSSILIKDKEIGFLGEVNKKIAQELGLKQKVYISEIDIQRLFIESKLDKKFKPPAKYPSIVRDLSLIIKKDIPVSVIISTVSKEARPLFERMELFDVYEGPQIPPGTKSLSFRVVFGAKNRTLQTEEVRALHNKICKRLSEKFQIVLR